MKRINNSFFISWLENSPGRTPQNMRKTAKIEIQTARYVTFVSELKMIKYSKSEYRNTSEICGEQNFETKIENRGSSNFSKNTGLHPPPPIPSCSSNLVDCREPCFLSRDLCHPRGRQWSPAPPDTPISFKFMPRAPLPPKDLAYSRHAQRNHTFPVFFVLVTQ